MLDTNNEKTINAIEMYLYRDMLKIPWLREKQLKKCYKKLLKREIYYELLENENPFNKKGSNTKYKICRKRKNM